MCMCVCVWEECSTGDVGSVTVRYGRLSSRSTDSSSCSKLRQGACSRRSFLPNLGSGKLARRSQEEDDRRGQQRLQSALPSQHTVIESWGSMCETCPGTTPNKRPQHILIANFTLERQGS